eukprot:TRINITY_DN1659_c0_g1_i17.p1 TRINITY_DN1659_c0_g1~~TRINITY_DN1659_c0_g1_i17.p1  ORF type:complete len:353 (+),score=74.78 TRINITY_DN1659_c0_g1_i17:46-1104(+)
MLAVSAFAGVVFATADVVDRSSMTGKYMMGYQGWFSTPCDGFGRGWSHWTCGGGGIPGPDPLDNGTLCFENWPDMSEYDADELCPTNLVYADGSNAGLYSAAHPKTVRRHIQWLKDAGVDGVWKQRFIATVTGNSSFNDRVAGNVEAACEATGRVWATMYDVSGQHGDVVLGALEEDWPKLEAWMQGDRYLHHRGRPAVAVWGMGFRSRMVNVSTAHAVLDFFESKNVTVVGGTPTWWRTGGHDVMNTTGWDEVFRRFAVISPWTVGRYSSVDGTRLETLQSVTQFIIPDLAEARRVGADYMPVVWPGGSAQHESRGVEHWNRAPRFGGWFLWRQLYNAINRAGSTGLWWTR